MSDFLNSSGRWEIYGNQPLERLGYHSEGLRRRHPNSARSSGLESRAREKTRMGASNELHVLIILRLGDFSLHGRRTRHVDEYNPEIGV